MGPELRRSVLSLYKNLLIYGRNLELTDKNYFTKRVREEFAKNKNLSDTSAIEHQISVSFL